MVQTENLRTASLYINNQLLSRGLLQDGQSIDFADSTTDGDTMGRIIGVVNDLILRRDRDAEHRESLATTLRTVRAESLRQTNDIQKLQERQAEAQRKINIADTTEASLRSQLKAAEASVTKLKDEAAKTRTLVAQTRSACANEVRKRDHQIDGLKKAVAEAGRARGERKNPAITTIAVTGELGALVEGEGTPQGATGSDNYDLRMETNAFLAELAKGLSEENETLLVLVRRTIQQLKDMSGFSGEGERGDGHVISLTASCEDMAGEIEAILQHLRGILTNPSFVPIEEVAVRENEIYQLRDGWVKMEHRWKEAVHLLDGWRKRMAVSGKSVNMEELKMGLRLSPVRVKDVEETSQGLGLRMSTVAEEEEEPSTVQSPSPDGSLHLVPAPEYIDPEDSDSESSIFEDVVDYNELEAEEPNVQILEQSVMMYSVDSSPLPPPPQLSPLKDSDTAGNRGASGNARGRKRPGDFTTIVEEKTKDSSHAGARAAPTTATKPVKAPQKQTKPSTKPTASRETTRSASAASQVSTASTDSVLLVKSANPSPVPQAATRPTKASSLKQQRPQQPAPTPTHSRTPSAASTKTATATSSTTQRHAKEPEDPSPPAPKISTDMPPPPLPPKTDRPRSPAKPTSSRLPRAANPAPVPQSPITTAAIAAKLAASERDAEVARVRAKLKAARTGKQPPQTSSKRTPSRENVDPVKKPLPPPTQDEEAELAGSGAAGGPPRKREARRASRAVSRRRSTLNPWELESLITGGVGVAGA